MYPSSSNFSEWHQLRNAVSSGQHNAVSSGQHIAYKNYTRSLVNRRIFWLLFCLTLHTYIVESVYIAHDIVDTILKSAVYWPQKTCVSPNDQQEAHMYNYILVITTEAQMFTRFSLCAVRFQI